MKSPDPFVAGHRLASRKAVAWLNRYAERMPDAQSRRALQRAAGELGQTMKSQRANLAYLKGKVS